jgi:hypothetical protein
VHENPESLVLHEIDEHGAVVAEATFELADQRGAATRRPAGSTRGLAAPSQTMGPEVA